MFFTCKFPWANIYFKRQEEFKRQQLWELSYRNLPSVLIRKKKKTNGVIRNLLMRRERKHSTALASHSELHSNSGYPFRTIDCLLPGQPNLKISELRKELECFSESHQDNAEVSFSPSGQTEKIMSLLKLPMYHAMKTSTRVHRWASIWTTLLLHIKGLWF